MAVVSFPLNKHFMPFGNILPYEIQDLILDFRGEILYQERDALIRSLSEEEIMKALGYRFDNILMESMMSSPDAHANAVSKIENTVYKIHGRIFRVSSYDIGDVMDGISLIVDLERIIDNDETPDDPIVSYWDSIEEVDKGITATQCFDVMSTNDIERLRPRDDDDFIHFAEYCFDIFRDIYNNRESN